MKIRLWGTRGSIPAPGPSTIRYGGNTSCVEVRLADDTLVILDAGSGIRPLGATLEQSEALLLLSHYHWDHIQGMPFFIPAYSPECSVRVLGPEFQGKGPGELLSAQMHAPYFPAPASQWVGVSGFDVVCPGASFRVGSAVIHTARLSHPGLTLGFRIEDEDSTFVYASDNEPDLAPADLLAGIVDLAEGADLLLHDCQFTEDEYSARRGWGHSTPRQAAGVASEAGVERLLLFHHDPAHHDEQVEALAEEACRLADRFEVQIAREGETIALGRQPSAIGKQPMEG